MKIQTLTLAREMNHWEARRAERIMLEDEFNNYTGIGIVIESHLPYTLFNHIKSMAKRISLLKCKKIIILNGDSVNFDLFSKFKNTSNDTSTPGREIEMLIDLMKYLESVFDKIIFVTANHDLRLLKVLSYSIADKAQAQAIKGFIKSFREIFDENNLVNVTYDPMYLFQIGDVICTHFEKNHKSPYTTCYQIWEDLIPRISKNWNVVFQSHTHRQIDVMINGKKIICTGALIDRLDYAQAGKIHYPYSSIGYGEFMMKNGKVDVNSCRYVVCGHESPI